MRILIDIRLLARGDKTGIPGYTRTLVSRLIAEHPNHTYLLFYNAFRRAPLPDSWRSAKNVTIIESRIPNRLLNLSYRLFNWPGLPVDADVIFSPHFNLLPRTKIPRVITFHDLSFLYDEHFFSPAQRFWHRMQNYKRQAQQASALISVSQATADDLTRLLGINSTKIKVIHSGISTEFQPIAAHDPELQNVLRKYSLTKPYILYLGTLETRKNIIALVKAFELVANNPKMRDFELVLAGKWGFGETEIKAAIHSSPIRHRIRVLGPVPDESRVYLYSHASTFVFVSWFEGFGFPPLEAQACGTPVVASSRTSLSEVLGTSAVFINPWRPRELADALIDLTSNPELRARIVARGLKNASNFSWKTTAAKTLAVLQWAQSK